MGFLFFMQTQWSKTANFYIPPVFNAPSQRELSEFMRGFYITEIYGHDVITVCVCLHWRLKSRLRKRDI